MITEKEIAEYYDRKIRLVNEEPNSEESKIFIRYCHELSANCLELQGTLSYISQQYISNSQMIDFIYSLNDTFYKMKKGSAVVDLNDVSLSHCPKKEE